MKVVERIILCIAMLTLVSCLYAEPTYTRAECITKVKLDWEVTGREKWNTMAEIMKEIALSADNGYKGPIPSTAYSGKNDENLYLQFPDQCDKKNERTKELINMYVRLNVASFPVYKISNDVVKPGPKTINVGGSQWKDGELPEFLELEKLKKN